MNHAADCPTLRRPDAIDSPAVFTVRVDYLATELEREKAHRNKYQAIVEAVSALLGLGMPVLEEGVLGAVQEIVHDRDQAIQTRNRAQARSSEDALEKQRLNKQVAELKARPVRFESEANQAHCELILLRNECVRLRELNAILSGFIEASHVNADEDVPDEIVAAMDAVFPPEVAALMPGAAINYNVVTVDSTGFCDTLAAHSSDVLREALTRICEDEHACAVLSPAEVLDQAIRAVWDHCTCACAVPVLEELRAKVGQI